MFQKASSLRRIGAVLVKELRQLRRDRPTLSMIVMIPLVQLLLFGYAIDTNPKHMPTTLLIKDDSPFARSFVQGLKNTEYFKVDGDTFSEDAAKALLQKGLTQFVITVPENFGRDLVRGQKPAVLIEADAADPTASASALASVSGVVDAVIRSDLSGPLGYLKTKELPFSVMTHKLYNPEGFSRYNIVPGLMGIVLTLTGVMMTALAHTRERERGTMENLLSMPIRPFEVMIGKIAPYMIIGFIQSALIVAAAQILFGVPILGSLSLLSAALLIFIICNLALGFTVSTGAHTQMQAMQFSFALFLPSVMLSGFMFPFFGMPHWAQVIGQALPVTYFIRIVRGILLKGATFAEVLPNMWPLLIFMIVAAIVALKLYRSTLD
ncbi:MAG: ABC transporter permease [Bdellovibrionales bacterium]